MNIMLEPPEQYASEEEREWIAGFLRMNLAAGRLNATELEERLRNAYASRTIGDLRATLAKLPLPEPAQRQAAPVEFPVSVLPFRGGHVDRRLEHTRSGLFRLAIAYASTMALLVGVWLSTGMGYAWFVWPLLAGGLALAARAATLLGGPHKP